MLVSCLLPTYGRIPRFTYLIEEAVESFLRQTYQDKELIICNDTPGQHLIFHHPQVRVINASHRFHTLGEKLHFMLEKAKGDYICRWDDDDISLPWRLSYSVAKIYGMSPRHDSQFDFTYGKPLLKEWRPENHWYCPRGGQPSITTNPGNTHIAAIWHRSVIFEAGVKYPGFECPSGLEDQTFTRHLRSLGYPQHGDILPMEDIFYLYRWGVSNNHLSGKGGGDTMQHTYADIGAVPPLQGEFVIKPQWHSNHSADIQEAIDYLRGKA
jgi:glycosyltransferase involved in cell wall biosynthesis